MNRKIFLGLDTRNYTTTAAIVEPESSTVCQSKKLMPVEQGELGLRQSDALFHHVQTLGDRVGEGMAGKMDARCIAVSLSVPLLHNGRAML